MGQHSTSSAQVLKLKNNPPTKCPKCGGASISVFSSGKAWCCDQCDEANDEYRRIDAALKAHVDAYEQTPEGIATKERIRAGIERINRNLKAADAESKIEDSDWSKLRAIAKIDFGLTFEEFWRLTPPEFNDLLERLIRKEALAAKTSTPKPLQATQERSSVPDYSSPLKRLIRTGLLTIKDKYSNKELRHWMKENAYTKDLRDQLVSKNPASLAVLRTAISKVRAAMNLQLPKRQYRQHSRQY